MRALPLLMLLAGCSETGLSTLDEQSSPAGSPQVAVEPEVVALGVICTDDQADVEVRNVGQGPLTLLEVQVDAGWTAQATELPTQLDPGVATTVRISGGRGPGTLRVITDDPVRPTLDVPIEGQRNAPPEITLHPPDSGWTLPAGGSTRLLATVTDPDEPVEGLEISWSSSVDGPLGSSLASADGTATFDWLAEARSAGPHSLHVEVADSCDARGTDTADLCQNRGYIADELELHSWNFEGAARWDSTRDAVLLTPPLTYQVGSAFQTSETIDASNVDIRFKFYMGGGTGADGLSLTVLDVDRMTSFLGAAGGGIGYAGLPGFSIEVDTHYNSAVDPTRDHHISFHLDGNQAEVLAWASLPTMDDGRWRDMHVTVDGRKVTASIDGVTYIDQEFADLHPFEGYIGFTAATGSLTNDHLIGDLKVERFVCDER